MAENITLSFFDFFFSFFLSTFVVVMGFVLVVGGVVMGFVAGCGCCCDGFCGFFFFFFFRLVVMVIVDLWVGDIWVLFPFHRWIVVVVDRGSRLRFDQVLDHGSWLDRC